MIRVQEVLVLACLAQDARETAIEDAALHELVGDLAHDRAPAAVRPLEALLVRLVELGEMVLDEAEEG
jgi:hypothetical protein